MMGVKYKLYGAILGDLTGQPFEFPAMQGPYTNVKIHNKESHFTDDTLMTLATARAILDNISFEQAYKEMFSMYQGDYYGKGFVEWAKTPMGTIGGSYGNGVIMRISPLMYIENKKQSRNKIIESVLTSHATQISLSASLQLLRLYNKKTKSTSNKQVKIKPFEKFEVRADKTFDFIKSLNENYFSTHSAIIKAIECGGDTDTNASIIGELMNYTYNDITLTDVRYVHSKLDPYLLSILKEFNKKFKNC